MEILTIFGIGIAFLLISVAGILAKRFNQSVIVAYIICGMIIGPYGIQINNSPIIANITLIEFMQLFGIVFLLLYFGLEFSINKLIKSKEQIFISSFFDLAINFPIGFILGIVFGFGIIESLFLGGIFYVSSTGIITKTIIELKRVANRETETILGIMIFEDIFIAIFLAIISGIAFAERTKNSLVVFLSYLGINITLDYHIAILITVINAFVFCLFFILIARKFSSQVEKTLNIESDELFLILIFSLVILSSVFARVFGLTEAIGAFFLGLVLAETEHAKRIKEKIIPFRDLFVAVFFFAFGMMIDWRNFNNFELIILLMIAIPLSVLGKFYTGIIAGKINNFTKKESYNIGLTIVSRGEISILLASVLIVAFPNSIVASFTAIYVLVLVIIGQLVLSNYL